MLDFPKPKTLNLDGNLRENWKRYKTQYEIFAKATKTDKEEETVQIARFLSCAGSEAIELYNTFDFAEGDKDKIQKVIQKFEEYCNPRTNVVYERYLFYTRSQKEGEPFDHFLKEISTLIENCSFGDQKDSILRDRIVIGIADHNTQMQLLKVDNLTLTKAIETCRVAEITGQQSRVMQHESAPSSSKSAVDAVNQSVGSYQKSTEFKNSDAKKFQNNFRNVKGKANQYKSNKKKMEKDCNFCGYAHIVGRCPAYGKKCKICHKSNHFASKCKARRQQVSDIIYDYSHDDDLDIYIDSLSVNNKRNTSCWTEKLKIDNCYVEFKLDTGSQVNILPKTILEKFRCSKLESYKPKLEAYGGFKLQVVGVTECVIEYGKSVHKMEFVVVDVNSRPLLGLNGCIQLGLIKRVQAIELDEKECFIRKHKEVFNGNGHFPDRCIIEVRDNVIPVNKPPRRIPLGLRDRVQKTLKEMEKRGIITRLDKPTEWSHNMVIVEKSDKSLRICLDPRELNLTIKDEHFMIPTFEDFRFEMRGMRYFTVLDLKEGFWQLKLTDESKKLTVFSTPFGSYEYNVLPFGIKTAPERFQKLNSKYFGNLPGTFVYIDDIIVGGKDIEEHDRNLERVIGRAKELNVKFNPNKLQYRVKQVKYLGHIFSAEGVVPDKSKVQAIVSIKNPTTRKELQKLLGTINFLRPFIPNLAEISAPLRQLLRKTIAFQWNQQHTNTLNKIKSLIQNACTLHSFDPQLPIVIQTDASRFGLGCCLLQNNKPISFASKSLTETEINYAQIEKELLAIVYACNKFHDYIYGREVTIHTDHKPLLAIVEKPFDKIHSIRLQRMKIKLLNYNLKLVYVPGKYLHVADLLSRNSQADELLKLDNILTDVVHSISMSEVKKNLYKKATKDDNLLQEIIKYYLEGWPKSKQKLPDHLKFTWDIKDRIYTEEGLLFYEDRIFVPSNMIKDTLKSLHENHFGITKTIARAKTIFYWPHMTRDIENFIKKCRKCEEYRASNCKQSLCPHDTPQYPYQKVGCDIFQFGGKDYLVIVDYYSKWLVVKSLIDKSAKSVIEALRETFCTYGIPEFVVCDNQPFNSYQCRDFSKSFNFDFIYSSPHYPKSNGLAEKAVHIVKSFLRKAEETNRDVNVFLLDYHSTPLVKLGVAPAQLLMSRVLRTKHPVQRELLYPRLVNDAVKNMNLNKIKQKRYYDRTAKRKEFNLNPGENIVYKRGNKWEPARVEKELSLPRTYLIRNEYNRILRRNTHHLRKSMNEPTFKTPEIANQELNDGNTSPDQQLIRNDMQRTEQQDVSNSVNNNNITSRENTSDGNNQTQELYRSRYGRICKPPKRYAP